MKHNKYLTAAFVGLAVFCAPAFMIDALKHYNEFGHKLGAWVYESTHSDTLND